MVSLRWRWSKVMLPVTEMANVLSCKDYRLLLLAHFYRHTGSAPVGITRSNPKVNTFSLLLLSFSVGTDMTLNTKQR